MSNSIKNVQAIYPLVGINDLHVVVSWRKRWLVREILSGVIIDIGEAWGRLLIRGQYSCGGLGCNMYLAKYAKFFKYLRIRCVEIP